LRVEEFDDALAFADDLRRHAATAAAATAEAATAAARRAEAAAAIVAAAAERRPVVEAAAIAAAKAAAAAVVKGFETKIAPTRIVTFVAPASTASAAAISIETHTLSFTFASSCILKNRRTPDEEGEDNRHERRDSPIRLRVIA